MLYEVITHHRVVFTKKMKEEFTLLCPQMSPIHFTVLERALSSCGYRLKILPNDNRQAIDVGLKFVNNDACFPSLMVVGQIMDALQSGEYDLDKVGIMINQTGGGCVITSYSIHYTKLYESRPDSRRSSCC